MHSILLLPIVARCLDTIDVAHVFKYVIVTVCGSMGTFVV